MCRLVRRSNDATSRQKYLWVSLDNGHSACPVRLLGVRPKEVVMFILEFRLLLPVGLDGKAARRRALRGYGSGRD